MAVLSPPAPRRPGFCRQHLLGIGMALCVVSGFGLDATTQAAPPSEYQLKAIFLFHFTQFVEWPRSAFPAPDSPLVIGILGEDPFGPYLDHTVQGEEVNGHPLEVRRYDRTEDIQACHILFVGQTEAARVEKLVTALTGRSVLTVADFEGFARRGGMIRFVTEKQVIRLRINVEAVKAAGLTISSKLLRLAEIIGPKED